MQVLAEALQYCLKGESVFFPEDTLGQKGDAPTGAGNPELQRVPSPRVWSGQKRSEALPVPAVGSGQKRSEAIPSPAIRHSAHPRKGRHRRVIELSPSDLEYLPVSDCDIQVVASSRLVPLH